MCGVDDLDFGQFAQTGLPLEEYCDFIKETASKNNINTIELINIINNSGIMEYSFDEVYVELTQGIVKDFQLVIFNAIRIPKQCYDYTVGKPCSQR